VGQCLLFQKKKPVIYSNGGPISTERIFCTKLRHGPGGSAEAAAHKDACRGEHGSPVMHVVDVCAWQSFSQTRARPREKKNPAFPVL
jgi:hypothetical protein